MPPDDVEAEALSHVPGSGAVSIEALGDGRVNQTFHVRREGIAYSMRVAGGVPAVGVDREWEKALLQIAGAAGLAPPITYCDPERGILILPWMGGRHWTVAEAGRADPLRKMALFLRRVHSLRAPTPARCMDPRQWIEMYGESGVPADLRAAAHRCLAALAQLPLAERVLCHSDLHVLNMIDAGGSLLLLDWEYAHLADGYWDLAGWSANNSLDARQRSALLSDYLGGPPAEAEHRRLALNVQLYDYVCWLWGRATLK